MENVIQTIRNAMAHLPDFIADDCQEKSNPNVSFPSDGVVMFRSKEYRVEFAGKDGFITFLEDYLRAVRRLVGHKLLPEVVKKMPASSVNQSTQVLSTNQHRMTNENMTLEEKMQRGTHLINEFAAFSPNEMFDFLEDLDCLKVWLKVKLHNYGARSVER
ncbi:hypothetical protein [Leptolyngbya sp. O-77]|uniref:hypothetical protein n=1 Tax=Leptolyngbya sp. O-77 TaxID=1080068 RepID=UPI00074D4C3B|nr:hypothetical protein [Leptolyngbya sp. O-77]BAU41425.1 hypothetical protein O77CONTIG1_01235 [Leptolyngbya sp. O-77]